MDEASWQPILSGAAQSQARARVQEIADSLHEQLDQHDFPALAGGLGGFCLFYNYCDAAFPDCGYGELAGELLQRAVGTAASHGLNVGLFGGHAGIAWLCDHVGATELDPDPNRPFDDLIMTALEGWSGDDDLINGLVGLGVYGLERAGRGAGPAIIERVIAHLADHACQMPGGLTWFTSPDRLVEWQRQRYTRGYYNLGLAHGVPGILGFLARACSSGYTRAEGLLHAGMDWLEAQAQDDDDASYAAVVPVNGTESPTRSGWCYGDPGVAAVFAASGVRCRQSAWLDRGVALARQVARRDVDRAGCRDAGLCHGSAGLGHVLNRIYQATGDETILAGARRWLLMALDDRVEGGIGGYREAQPTSDELHWEESAGLLTGAAGIGLALLAASSDVHPDWDRLLLLDVQP